MIILRRVLVASSVFALLFSLAACGSQSSMETESLSAKKTEVAAKDAAKQAKEKAEAEERERKRKAEEERKRKQAEEEAKRSKAPNVVQFPEDVDYLHWSGGAIVYFRKWNGDKENPEFNFGIWTPALTTPQECTIRPLLSGEVVSKSIMADWDKTFGIDVMATVGDEIFAGITFDARKKASGLTPDKATVYYQTLDVKTCTLGKRIDLGVSLEGAGASLNANFVGYGEKNLAILTGTNIVIVDAKSGEIVKKLESDSSFEKASPVAKNIMYTYSGYNLDYTESFYQVDTGELLLSSRLEDKSKPQYFRIPDEYNTATGPNTAVIRRKTDDGSEDVLLSGSEVISLSKDSGSFEPFMYSQVDDKNWITFGAIKTSNCGWNSEPCEIKVLTSSGDLLPFLSTEKLAPLQAVIIAISGDYVYLKTTTEVLELTSTGKETGRRWNLKDHEFPRYMDYRFVMGESWVLWGIDSPQVVRAGYVPWDSSEKAPAVEE